MSRDFFGETEESFSFLLRLWGWARRSLQLARGVRQLQGKHISNFDYRSR